MKVNVKWTGSGFAFDGTNDSGHVMRMDVAAASGGEDSGFRPMETVLLGMGGCTAFDVVSILKKSRQDIDGCEATITAERAEDIPKIFTKIHIHFIVTGKDVAPERVERAITLSAEKYCSAAAMLEKTAEITHDFEIVQP